jgi:hypothetical protein
LEEKMVSIICAVLMLLNLQAKPPAPSKPALEPFKIAQTFTATTVNLAPGGAEAVSISIARWSTDAERDGLAGALTAKAEAGFQIALAYSDTLGYIWTSEILGYPIRYAHRMTMPDGSERILVATDRRLGAWSTSWRAAAPGAPDYPFTLIELRIPRRGPAEGKMSLASKIVVEPTGKVIAIENYAAAPVLLKDVRRQVAAASTSTTG